MFFGASLTVYFLIALIISWNGLKSFSLDVLEGIMGISMNLTIYTFVTFVISLKLLKVSPIVEEDIHGPLLLSLVFGVAVPSMNKVIYKFILSLRSNIIKKYEAILAITSMCTYISIIIFFFYG